MSESPSPDAVAGRGAMIAARVLLALATLLTVVAIVALWVNRQALDTNDWTRTSTRLLQDARIRSALSTYLVDQLYANVDVAGELRSLAPKDLKPLAGPAAGGVRDLLAQGADQLLQLPRVQDAWRQAFPAPRCSPDSSSASSSRCGAGGSSSSAAPRSRQARR